MKVFALLIAASLASPALADVTPLELLKQRLYTVRHASGALDLLLREEGRAGIWEWRPASNTYTRLLPLLAGPHGSIDPIRIAGLEDRIVVMGTTFIEFEAATNRVLRTYSALPAGSGRWAFQGAVVTEAMADEMGLASGYYGHLRCPSAFSISGGTCGPTTFPGAPDVTEKSSVRHLLYRRGINPADNKIELVKDFGGPAAYVVTADPGRRRFWFVAAVQGTNTVQTQFGYLPVMAGAIGDPVVVEYDERLYAIRSPSGIHYDRGSDSLLIDWGSFITRRPADLSTAEVVFAHFGVLNDEGIPSDIAQLAPETPAFYQQLVPAVGNGPGANGTWWRSDVWMFNPSDRVATATIRRVSSPHRLERVDLPAHGSLELTDVLGRLGGGPAIDGGDGLNTDALVIESPYRWGEQMKIYSRTYTHAASGTGTYGQAVPALPGRDGYSTLTASRTSQEAFFVSSPASFAIDLRNPGQFRHNLGVVNDSEIPLELTIDLGETKQISVPARTVANISVESLVGTGMPPGVWPLVLHGVRNAPTWLSMIDNKTGDATFVPYSNMFLNGAVDATIAIPQIANVPGAYDTTWRTDLYGSFGLPAYDFGNPGGLRAIFYPADANRCAGNTKVEAMVGGGSRWFFPDLVKLMPGCESENLKGAFELNSGSWMAGYARTYSTRDDGGTFGDMLPFYPSGGWPVQHFSGIRINREFRINLGLYNGSDHPVAHRLTVYDAAGNEITRKELILSPRVSRQAPLSEFVGHLPDGLYGLTVLPLHTSERPGRSWAYVSIIDNVTGDPTNLW